jgi:hypothetical protein
MFFYQSLRSNFRLPSEVSERISAGKCAALDPFHDVLRALNTFCSLIISLHNSESVLCLNRVASNPLEHLFERNRPRRRDLNVSVHFVSHSSANSTRTCEFLFETLISMCAFLPIDGSDSVPRAIIQLRRPWAACAVSTAISPILELFASPHPSCPADDSSDLRRSARPSRYPAARWPLNCGRVQDPDASVSFSGHTLRQ